MHMHNNPDGTGKTERAVIFGLKCDPVGFIFQVGAAEGNSCDVGVGQGQGCSKKKNWGENCAVKKNCQVSVFVHRIVFNVESGKWQNDGKKGRWKKGWGESGLVRRVNGVEREGRTRNERAFRREMKRTVPSPCRACRS